MKYMLMMNTRRTGYEEFLRWPKEVLQANIAFMIEFGAKLRAAGELVSTEGLSAPAQARLVRAGRDGKPVTDGVFPEAKEFLAGYWIVDVESPERAYEIAALASTAPGPDDQPPLYVEVRPIMSGRQDMGL